jgi:hypothetical protein
MYRDLLDTLWPADGGLPPYSSDNMYTYMSHKYVKYVEFSDYVTDHVPNHQNLAVRYQHLVEV